jgi:hypothetical protein
MHHVSDTDCPPGPAMMMGPEHRAGCGNGKRCLGHEPTTGGPARATWYVRGDRAFYLCSSCAKPFARIHGIDIGGRDGR